MNNEAHGGLQLDAAVTDIGESEAQQIHGEWTSYPEVKNYLETHLALVVPNEPEFACPPLRVEDLTTTDSKAYTEAYAQRVAWHGFYLERKSEHDAIVLELEAEMSVIETRIRQSMRKNSKKVTSAGDQKSPPVNVMDDAINSDTRYLELKKQVVMHRQILKRLNARCENLETEIKLTSRQVEIRRQDFHNAGLGGQGVRRDLPGPGMRGPYRREG